MIGLKKLHNVYMAAIVDIISRHGLGIDSDLFVYNDLFVSMMHTCGDRPERVNE